MTDGTDRTLARATIGGIEMAYEDHGTGLPCLLVHGFPFDHRQWRAQLEGLADAARWIVPDLRGHGSSAAPPPPYRMSDFAEDLRGLLDRLGIDRVVLGGLSMGGYIALAFAERYPERLRGLVLMATRAEDDPDTARQQRMETAARARTGGAALIGAEMLDRILGGRDVDPQLVEAIRTMILGTSVEGLVGSLEGMAMRADATPWLASIECPTLVVVGTEDQLTPPSCARHLAASIPDAELLEVPEAGHVVALERPEIVNPAIERLLARCR